MIVSVATSSPSTEVRILLDAACEQMPPKVRDFVLDNIYFAIISGTDHGQAIPYELIKPGRIWGDPKCVDRAAWWIVLLYEGALVGVPTEEAHSLIAHEVAHAFAGVEAKHFAVAELARSWGFTGRAANPERFRE